MTRDPSDGSVKEDKPLETKGLQASNPVLSTTSGLPFGSTKPEHIQRLDKSREQLKRYHETGVWDDERADGQTAKGLRPDREGLEQQGNR